jgi:hypothetical protein
MDTKILYEKIYKENEYNYGGYNNEMQKIKKSHNPEAWLLIQEL